MDENQRRVMALTAYAVAVILFVFLFVRPFWAWASWDASHGTLDLGIVKFTTRPPFPGDARSVGLGLIVPVVIAALGRIVQGARGR